MSEKELLLFKAFDQQRNKICYFSQNPLFQIHCFNKWKWWNMLQTKSLLAGIPRKTNPSNNLFQRCLRVHAKYYNDNIARSLNIFLGIFKIVRLKNQTEFGCRVWASSRYYFITKRTEVIIVVDSRLHRNAFAFTVGRVIFGKQTVNAVWCLMPNVESMTRMHDRPSLIFTPIGMIQISYLRGT